MPAPNRRDRAQRAYAEAFSEAIRELKVPMPALCSVVKVDMSSDLRSVKVYVSLYGEGHARSESGRSLRRARAFLQGEVGRRMGLRFTPSLTIETDHSLEKLSSLPHLPASTGTVDGAVPADSPSPVDPAGALQEERSHDGEEGPGRGDR